MIGNEEKATAATEATAAHLQFQNHIEFFFYTYYIEKKYYTADILNIKKKRPRGLEEGNSHF